MLLRQGVPSGARRVVRRVLLDLGATVNPDWTDNYRYAAVLLDAADVFLAYGMSMAARDARWLAGELIARADANTLRGGR